MPIINCSELAPPFSKSPTNFSNSFSSTALLAIYWVINGILENLESSRNWVGFSVIKGSIPYQISLGRLWSLASSSCWISSEAMSHLSLVFILWMAAAKYNRTTGELSSLAINLNFKSASLPGFISSQSNWMAQARMWGSWSASILINSLSLNPPVWCKAHIALSLQFGFLSFSKIIFKSLFVFVCSFPLILRLCKIPRALLACQSLVFVCKLPNSLSVIWLRSAYLPSKSFAKDFSGAILKIRPVSSFNTSFPQISASCQSNA